MTHSDPMAGIPASAFVRRRAMAMAALADGVMVLPAAPVLYRSRDTGIPYRPDSELFYLTGATEPGTVAVLAGGSEPRFILFASERDPEAELWSGPRLGPEAAAERYGADETHPRAEMEFRLSTLLRAADRVHYRLGRDDALDRLVLGALAHARVRGARAGTGPRGIVDPGEILDDLRLVKDVHEIARLRAAAALSVEGHRHAAAALAPGVGEWIVEAAVNGAFRRAGATGPAYETIVGSGPNACVLHYVANARTIGDGDLVLVDAGAEQGLYHGDVTRTYPAGGRFSGAQRDVYDLVVAAHDDALARVAPGATIADVHAAAVRTVMEGLVGLGVLEGDPGVLVEQDAHRPFFPHQTSHWLGLDVHDPGDYARRGAARVLEPGMVFTVEPGLYFPPDAQGGAASFAGIGVRVEDDVIVTDAGHERLTGELPVRADAVEALVAEARRASR